MANTYHKIHIHTIFAVKFRKGLIQPQWEEKLYSVIGNLIKESGGKPIIINGVEDHVHCFFPCQAICCHIRDHEIGESKVF